MEGPSSQNNAAQGNKTDAGWSPGSSGQFSQQDSPPSLSSPRQTVPALGDPAALANSCMAFGYDDQPALTIQSDEGENTRVAYGWACTKGYRPDMEDAHTVEIELLPNQHLSLFSVFDGHGGRQVADLCGENVVDALRSSPSFKQGDYEAALRECFFELDRRALGHTASHTAGATATVALVHGQDLYVAGVGDSRCVLCHAGSALMMTQDHKPEDPKERQRIQDAGGFVIRGRVNANLNVSRALGDAAFKAETRLSASAQQVSPEPDIRTAVLGRRDTFMVVACDGVWNSLPDQEVVAYVQRRLNLDHSLQKIAEGLVGECLLPQHTAYDNITAIIVKFKFTAGAVEGVDPNSLVQHPQVSYPLAVPGAAAPAPMPPAVAIAQQQQQQQQHQQLMAAAAAAGQRTWS